MKNLIRIFLLILIFAQVTISEPLRVGISVPLTGDIAEYGTAVKNGFELAKNENSSQFRDIELSFEDNQYDSKKAISAYNKLVTFNKVSLIYNWGEAPLNAVAPLAERNKIPLLSLSLDANPAKDKKYVIRTINSSYEYANCLLKHLEKRKIKNIGIIALEDPFIDSMIDGLKASVSETQNIDIAYTFLPDTIDFKTAILKLKAKNYDAIGVYLFPGQVSTFYKQAAAYGLRTPTFGTDIFESKTEAKQANGLMDGSVFPSVNVPKNFLEKYEKKFSNVIQIAYGYNAYVVAKMLPAIKKELPENYSGQDVLKSISKIKDSSFKLTVDKFGKYFQFPLVVKEVNGLKFEVL